MDKRRILGETLARRINCRLRYLVCHYRSKHKLSENVENVRPGPSIPLAVTASGDATKESNDTAICKDPSDYSSGLSQSRGTGPQPVQNSSPKQERFNHPTGKAPKSVVILGLGPTANDWHIGNNSYDPPFPVCDEVWTVNKGFRAQIADVVFIMDDLEGERRHSRRYARDINRLTRPVMTSIIDERVRENYPDANLFLYPIYQVIDFYGGVFLARVAQRTRDGMVIGNNVAASFTKDDVRKAGMRVAGYLMNSIPLMLAYAGFIGVEKIQMFGCDYDFPGMSVHEADKPNAEYWINGLQMGLGVEFQFPARSTICSTNKGRHIYGYGTRQPFLNPDWFAQ